MLRYILPVIGLVLLFLLVAYNWPIEPFQHYLAIHTGTLNESSAYYGFWSGFGSILERIIELIVIGFLVLYHRNCHQKGCLRIGHFDVEGTPYKACRKHHPTVPDKAHKDEIRDAHREAHRDNGARTG
jgi:hypothetical protein